MKKTLVTLTATLICVGAFAQGKIAFKNDSVHLVYLTTDTALLKAADQSKAGGLPNAGGTLPSGVTLVADLYGGTSSAALVFQATTSFSATSLGVFNTVNVSATGVAGGTTGFFQVQIRDTAFPTADAS